MSGLELPFLHQLTSAIKVLSLFTTRPRQPLDVHRPQASRSLGWKEHIEILLLAAELDLGWKATSPRTLVETDSAESMRVVRM